MPIFVHPEKCTQVPWGVSGMSVFRCGVLSHGAVAPSCTISLLTPHASQSPSLFWIIFLMLSHISKDRKPKPKNPTTKNKTSFFPGERISYSMTRSVCVLSSLSPSFPSGTGCLSALSCWNNTRQDLPGQFQASLRPKNSEGFENQSTCQCLHGEGAIVSRNTIDFFKLSIYIRFLAPCIYRAERVLEISTRWNWPYTYLHLCLVCSLFPGLAVASSASETQYSPFRSHQKECFPGI